MSDFGKRHGYQDHLPARIDLERDSSKLRGLIWNIASNNGQSAKAGYRKLCQVLGELADPDVWSEGSSADAAIRLIDDLSWVDTYEVLESLYLSARPGARADIESEVNSALERSGLAYEMRDGRFEILDSEARALGLRSDENDVLEVLDDEFSPVRAQFAKAIAKLHSRPSDLEGAVGDALNALEAVTVIVTGRKGKTLGALSKDLFADGEGYHQSLREAISKLYGYSSSLPGARHGRYAEPTIAFAETAMVVRIVGSMIVFLITDYRSRS